MTRRSKRITFWPACGAHDERPEPAFESAKMLNINPDECIDCGACVPACPVAAIFALDETPRKWDAFIGKNREYYVREAD